jgi:hypothetical protein
MPSRMMLRDAPRDRGGQLLGGRQIGPGKGWRQSGNRHPISDVGQ